MSQDVQKHIDALKQRNARVEADKAWETSWTRRGLIALFTYVVIVLFFTVADVGNPFVNAIVPTIGFSLSTITVPLAKRWWLKRIYSA